MLDDFSMVDKRMVLRNKVPVDETGNWDQHMIMTFRKNPAYIFLNVDNLRAKSYKEYERTMREIWDYIS